jgi:hypothetical protein
MCRHSQRPNAPGERCARLRRQAPRRSERRLPPDPVKPDAHRRLALRGADLVLLAMHPRGTDRRACNNTMLVVECDGPIAPERVRQSLDRFLDFCPWPAARLRRSFPWGRFHWAAGRRSALELPAVRHRTVASPPEVQQALDTELNRPIDPRNASPVQVLIIDREEEPSAPGLLVLNWFHPLMDPRGGQNLLTHLVYLDACGGEIAWPGGLPSFVPEPDRRSLRERGRIARQSLDHLRRLAPVPPVSPARPHAESSRVCFRHDSFREGDPGQRSRRLAREVSWRLAVVGKAMAELWDRRGLPDVPFLLPVSVDLRPKGEPGSTFGNMLAFHFARFRPSETADIPALARTLRRQMAESVREGQIEANAVAMEFLRYRPVSMMLRALPWTSRGEIFSFNCADITEFPPALDRVFGRRVFNAYHVPAVPPRPGIGVFFNLCAGRDNLVVAWREGVVSEGEAARIVDVVREGMQWVPAP